jgi:Holliday junction DNA helicase RuvA
MIAYLEGTIREKTPTQALIVCGGVGYAVMISLATFERLADVGRDGALHTHLVVREDALTLYGFAQTEEREMFQLLTTVSGVGPKIAIGVLSSIGVDTLKENIARGNAAALTALPGIGKKTAERIVLELKEKLGSDDVVALPTAAGGASSSHVVARDALVELGYTVTEAEQALARVDPDLPAEERVREALRSAA